MPLLRNGQWVDNNPWVKLNDEDDIPTPKEGSDLAAVSLQRFISLSEDNIHTVSAVWLESTDDVSLLSDYLELVQLIIIDFPVFTDGRGYTQARQLRTQLGFSGELRASGDVRADQILFMARSGIDTFDFSEKQDEELINEILSRFSSSYQPSYALPIAG